MANDHQPSLSRAPSRASLGRVVVDLTSRLEVWGKAAGHLLAIWTVAAGVILAWMHLATGDYLAAFGQLGSSAFGETAGFLAAMLPTILRLMAAVTGLMMFPMLAGFVSGTERHAFAAAFRWRGRRGVAAEPFAVLHLPAFAVTLVLIVSFFAPAYVGWVFLAAMTLAGGVMCWWIGRRAARKAREARPALWVRSLPIVIYANVAFVVWLVLTTDLAFDIFRAPLASLPLRAGSSVACLMVAGLLTSYVFLSVLPRPTALGVIVCVVALGVVNYDNRKIAGAFLRAARLGGGIPQVYYPDANHPQLACLILAIGESRIVWIPDEKTAKAPAPCRSEKYRAHFAPRARQDAQDPFKAAAGTRTLKREDFRGPPAAPVGSTD